MSRQTLARPVDTLTVADGVSVCSFVGRPDHEPRELGQRHRDRPHWRNAQSPASNELIPSLRTLSLLHSFKYL